MRRTRAIMLSGTMALLAGAVPCRAGPAVPELACAKLDGTAFDACIADEAKTAGEALTPAYRATTKASDAACSTLPGPAIGACLEDAQRTADQTLNTLYKHALASIREGSLTDGEAATWRKRLEDAQRKWVAFRDADCGALIGSEWNDGTGAGAASAQCILGKTIMRAEELRSRYLTR